MIAKEVLMFFYATYTQFIESVKNCVNKNVALNFNNMVGTCTLSSGTCIKGKPLTVLC